MTIAATDIGKAASNETCGAKPSILSQTVPGFTAPNIVLWSVVFWENYINLNFNAPYTETYLTAPIMIATLKLSMLATVAFIFGWMVKLMRGSDAELSLFRPLLMCWFMSASVWTFYLIFRDWALRPEQMDVYYAPPDPLASVLFSFFDIWPTYEKFIWTYAAESLIFLCLGWGVYAVFSTTWGRLRRQGGTTDTGARVVTAQQAIVAVLFYSYLNGIFAFLIRA